MRMSWFLIGGIAGIAATMYISRNSRPIMYSLSQAGDSVNRIVDTAKSKMKKAQDNFNQSEDETFEGKKANLDKVNQIASQDPEVKHQINEILEENNQNPYQTQ